MFRTPPSVDTIRVIDKNGANCTISFIQDNNFNAAAERLSAQLLNELIKIRDSNILINVSEVTKNNIRKISEDFGQQSNKFRAMFKPILNGLMALVADEEEIISLSQSDSDKLQSIKIKFNALNIARSKFASINFDLTSLLNLIDKRCIQFQEQINKINIETSKEAHQNYSELLAGQKKLAIKLREAYQSLAKLEQHEASLYSRAKTDLAALEEKINAQQVISLESVSPMSGNIRLRVSSPTSRKEDSSPSSSSNSNDRKKDDSSSQDSPVFAPRKNNPPVRSFLHHHNRVQPVRDIELTAAHHQQALQPSQPLHEEGTQSFCRCM